MKAEITDVIKTFADAAKATGRPETPDFSTVPEHLRGYFEAQYQMVVIAAALNEGWEADWDNESERKYSPWFYKTEKGVSSGFVFNYTFYDFSYANAGYGARLCFKTEALAEYAARQFIDIWNKILLK